MDRPAPPQTADERGTLVGLLDFLRATVMLKMDGVADDDARRATVAASTMTPMGTVKHLTAVERWWFSVDFAGHDVEWPWPDGASNDGFELDDDDTVESVLDAYRREIAASNEVIAAASFDDLAAAPPNEPFNLRYTVAHMIEETGRHCGHLDLCARASTGPGASNHP